MRTEMRAEYVPPRQGHIVITDVTGAKHRYTLEEARAFKKFSGPLASGDTSVFQLYMIVDHALREAPSQ